MCYALLLDISPTSSDSLVTPDDQVEQKQQDRVWLVGVLMGVIVSLAFFCSVQIKEDLKRLKFGLSNG